MVDNTRFDSSICRIDQNYNIITIPYCPCSSLILATTHIKPCQLFTYIGTYIGSIKSNDSTCLHDIQSGICIAKQKMVQLNNIWKDRCIHLTLKIKLLKCLIWLVVMYGCKAWTPRKQESNKQRQERCRLQQVTQGKLDR